MPLSLPIVVGVSGASGTIYARRLVDVLLRAGAEVHLVFSPAAAEVAKEELDLSIDLANFDPASFVTGPAEKLRYWRTNDFRAGIASGSFRTAGMAVCPCSMSTLASIASGVTENLLLRAADVHLKERRKLVLVPRETPLSLIHLENMVAVTRAGGVVLPASPGFYGKAETVSHLVDFVVARICDQLGVDAGLSNRWGE
jgi:4-hydroxy-3-polyprenylbenzoate decarboxylase